MASVIKRGGRWYARWKTADGKWTRHVTTAATRAEARRLAEDIERQAERQRHGLEPLPPRDGGGTLAQLMEWWLERYSSGTPSHERNVYTVNAHLPGSELGQMRLAEVRPGHIETFLQQKAGSLSAQTVNHLRRFLVSGFSRAIDAGRWSGSNPAKLTKARRVHRKPADYLRVEEVAPLLVALDEAWRPLFATAIYTGLRKGELLALRKADLDLRGRRLLVSRTNTRDTTKGGKPGSVPLCAEVAPYLEAAVAMSPSELLFPGADGRPMRADVKLHGVLRRAMGRAGLATGYEHRCRRKGCGYREEAPDGALRRCPNHDRELGPKLWPVPRVRPLRFHDLRHTTASLLVSAGVPIMAVSRILRHSDIRVTSDVYSHLAPEYLTAEVDRLKLGGDAPELLEPMRAVVAAAQRGPPVVQGVGQKDASPEPAGVSSVDSGLFAARSRGLEPLTSGVTGRRSNQLN